MVFATANQHDEFKGGYHEILHYRFYSIYSFHVFYSTCLYLFTFSFNTNPF